MATSFEVSHEKRSPEYMTYLIRGLLGGVPVSVDTRYSDLRELHLLLKRELKDEELPKFPAKKLVGHMDQDFARQRSVDLQQWLNDMPSTVLRCEPMQQFLLAQPLPMTPSADAMPRTPASSVRNVLGAEDGTQFHLSTSEGSNTGSADDRPSAYSPSSQDPVTPGRLMEMGLSDSEATPEQTPAPSLASSQSIGATFENLSPRRLNDALTSLNRHQGEGNCRVSPAQLQ